MFIDELHILLGLGKAEGSVDASNLLKPALARGQLQCCGATTIDEYRKYIEKMQLLLDVFSLFMLKSLQLKMPSLFSEALRNDMRFIMVSVSPMLLLSPLLFTLIDTSQTDFFPTKPSTLSMRHVRLLDYSMSQNPTSYSNLTAK